MRALVLCDDYWHPAHNVRTGLQPLENQGVAFDWVEKADQWPVECIGEYSVVVLAKWNHVSCTDQRPWITEEVQDAFINYVCRGHGLLVIHAGLAGLRNQPRLRSLVGGSFISHPPQCPVMVEPHPEHRITAASAPFSPEPLSPEPFSLPDEHYFVELDHQNADVFLTTVSEHGSQPGGWTRIADGGRVCVLTPGHNRDVWLHPSYQSLLLNALRWCGGTT